MHFIDKFDSGIVHFWKIKLMEQNENPMWVVAKQISADAKNERLK